LYALRVPKKSATPPVEAGFKSQDFTVEKRQNYRAKLSFGRTDNVKFSIAHEPPIAPEEGQKPMSLFRCSKCGCAEDTALCHYWSAAFGTLHLNAPIVILTSENGVVSSRVRPSRSGTSAKSSVG
jgi:hypothetical protein